MVTFCLGVNSQRKENRKIDMEGNQTPSGHSFTTNRDDYSATWDVSGKTVWNHFDFQLSDGGRGE